MIFSENNPEELISDLIRLERENRELKRLLNGAMEIRGKIAELVEDHGQYRDLVEAVEMKILSLKSNK
jgi:hypothetical protein